MIYANAGWENTNLLVHWIHAIDNIDSIHRQIKN